MPRLDLPPCRRLGALDSTLRTVLTQAIADTGLSQREIARRAGLDRSTVGYVLNGTRRGTLDTWDLILTAAGVELGYRIITRVDPLTGARLRS